MQRFWDKVNKTEDCWEWIGAIRGNSGYGCIKINGKNQNAHRVSWELSFGKIPVEKLVCHHCDNRRCVRPDHLFLGSYTDNILDSFSKGRVSWNKGKMFTKHGIITMYAKHKCRCEKCKLVKKKVNAMRYL